MVYYLGFASEQLGMCEWGKRRRKICDIADFHSWMMDPLGRFSLYLVIAQH